MLFILQLNSNCPIKFVVMEINHRASVDLVRLVLMTGIPTAVISFFSDTQDILWDSFCRGKMWVQLGLVLSLILSPVGKVDPVEKNSIELQHVKEEVTPLLIVVSTLIEIRTVWFRPSS